jgi:sulfur relay (sulfurtransferase) complex TusBCD TusD component (DsrE family)
MQLKSTISTVLLFTRNGMGEGPADLQQKLAEKYLTLTLASGILPDRIIFYTQGVHLVCEGSQVLSQLQEMTSRGVDLIICKTCTDTFGVTDKVKVGVIGGMPDILETLQKADKVISL